MANYRSSYTGAYIDAVMAQKRSPGYFPTYASTAGAIGSDTKSIYIDSDGIIQPSAKSLITQDTKGTVGNSYTPVYINSNGQSVACDVMPRGSAAKPSVISIPLIGTDGVMEVGQYIDFHNSTTSSDNTFRIANNGEGTLTFYGHSLSMVHRTTNKTGLQFWQDTEGGSIRLYKYNSDANYEMDMYGDHLRIYTNSINNTTYRYWYFINNGSFQTYKGIRVVQNVGSSWLDFVQDYSTDIARAGLTIENVPDNAEGSAVWPWVRQRIYDRAWGIGVLSRVQFVIGQKLTGNTTNALATALVHNANGITYSTNGFATGSDRRLKNILGNMSDEEALTLLNNINIVNYTWKSKMVEENNINNGIIAQDLIKILKDNNIGDRGYLSKIQLQKLDEYDEDEDEIINRENQEENPNGMDIRDYYTIKYAELVPLCIKGWQIQEKKINDLETRIAKLEAYIEQLENK